MYRSLKLTAAALAITAVLTGVTYAATRPIPEKQPQVALQNTTDVQLPGDAKALEAALQAGGPVQYKILVIDSSDGEDKTDYLDRVAEKWGLPAADTLYLVLYAKENYDIRFYMGANFRSGNVSVDEMLGMVRNLYLAKSQKGDTAGGLADLINAVNQRMGGTAAAKTAYTVPDPFGGVRQSAAGQLEIAKGLLTQYLDHYKAAAIPEADRLMAYRWDDNNINPVESTDTKIVFMIKYDVSPVAGEQSAWIAGNGQYGSNGWIVGKSQFMTVVKEGAVWKLEGLATSR
jgi:uncharacterized membrane protein YgcG